MNSINSSQLVLYDESTRTYYVDGQPVCLAEQKSNGAQHQLCALRAGHGTSHLGTGRCKFHGGDLGTNTLHITTGRYAKVANARLRAQIEHYESDPYILDLIPELNLLRANLDSVVEMYQDAEPGSDAYVFGLRWRADLIERIGNMVERIERINRDHVLTAANARYAMLRAIDVASHFIPQERMGEFIRLWHREVVEPVSAKVLVIE